MARTTASIAKRATRAGTSARKAGTRRIVLLVATRKGAWLLHGDASRRRWRLDGPHFLGHVINHLVLDPRDGARCSPRRDRPPRADRVRSTDRGRTWKEAARPPAFDKRDDGSGRSVDHTFWLTPAHENEPGIWYAGTSPQGLFRSADGGLTWAPFSHVNDDPQYLKWFGTVQDARPTGRSCTRSSSTRATRSTFTSACRRRRARVDRRRRDLPHADRRPRRGRGIPRDDPSMHDPHCIRICRAPGPAVPAEPLRHLPDRPAVEHLGADRQEDAEEGRRHRLQHVVHPRDATWRGCCRWPAAASGRAPAPTAKPAVYGTRNGGKNLAALDAGMPREQAWWTVKRQAMCATPATRSACIFGTTAASCGRAATRAASGCIARGLPEIYAVEAGELR